jgi:hypothetical protein
MLVERCITRFRPLQPAAVFHPRPALLAARAAGEVAGQVPRRAERHPVQERALAADGRPDRASVFDDGAFVTERTLTAIVAERTLTAIGDDRTLNAGAKIQGHSQEDGTFKSHRITIGAAARSGPGSCP